MRSNDDFLADTLAIDTGVGLIGLGRRGCEQVRRLRHAGLAEITHGFLIDHDIEYRHDPSTDLDAVEWIGNTATLPDFSACELLAIVIIGAEHQDRSEQLSLKLGLFKERPTLVLGIILPPPAGQSSRLKSALLREMDSIVHWPGDPLEPSSWALLQTAVSTLSNAFLEKSIPVNIADLINLFSGTSQRLFVASHTRERSDEDSAHTALYSALADLYPQGFKPDQVTGLLLVIRADPDYKSDQLPAVCVLLRDILAANATMTALLLPANNWQMRLQVTLFATAPNSPSHLALHD